MLGQLLKDHKTARSFATQLGYRAAHEQIKNACKAQAGNRRQEEIHRAAPSHAAKPCEVASAQLHTGRTAQGENSARPRCVSCATVTPACAQRSDAAPSTSAAAASGQLSCPVCAFTKGTRLTSSAAPETRAAVGQGVLI